MTIRKERWQSIAFVAGVAMFYVSGLFLYARILFSGNSMRRDAIGMAAVILGAYVLAIARVAWLRRKRPNSVSWRVLVYTGVFMVGILAMHGITNTTIDNVVSWIKGAPTTLIGLLGVCAVAGGLFYFRLRLRTLYGLSEFIFAIGLAWHILPGNPVAEVNISDLQLVALMTGCVYLMVRGLDNMHQGLETDRIVRWMRQKAGWQAAETVTV